MLTVKTERPCTASVLSPNVLAFASEGDLAVRLQVTKIDSQPTRRLVTITLHFGALDDMSLPSGDKWQVRLTPVCTCEPYRCHSQPSLLNLDRDPSSELRATGDVLLPNPCRPQHLVVEILPRSWLYRNVMGWRGPTFAISVPQTNHNPPV